MILGIVVEELVRECIGENWHKIFIEQRTVDEEGHQDGGIIGDGERSLEEIDSEGVATLAPSSYQLSNLSSEDKLEEEFHNDFSNAIERYPENDP
jgi:hypothetical protein